MVEVFADLIQLNFVQVSISDDRDQFFQEELSREVHIIQGPVFLHKDLVLLGDVLELESVRFGFEGIDYFEDVSLEWVLPAQLLVGENEAIGGGQHVQVVDFFPAHPFFCAFHHILDEFLQILVATVIARAYLSRVSSFWKRLSVFSWVLMASSEGFVSRTAISMMSRSSSFFLRMSGVLLMSTIWLMFRNS